ncbi:hypothetical protein PSN45_001301 [Yamadazyma tenuis]|uniref:uncharacterized protein n=1 Tax=Candida tenuis TaxID=2315449 RepID=UPI0027A970A3|nr:hypothetical protein PSN45_001301 [Yamadazyma tenuis]
MSKPDKLALRRRLYKLGHFYYNQAIQQLREVLAHTRFNVELAIVVSDFLNRVSILEFKNLHNSVVFSQGLTSIFQHSVVAEARHRPSKSISPELNRIFALIIFATASRQYPSYPHTLLYEFQEQIWEFEVHYAHLFTSISRFYVNHLKHYTQMLIGLFESTPAAQIQADYHLVFKVLRQWLINLPSRVQLIDFIEDPVEYVGLRLYQTLAMILNNIFPTVSGWFLTDFRGSLVMFNTPDYHYKTPTRLSQFPVLQDLNTYCVRSLNEVPIDTFKSTVIKNYHYLHIPESVQFTSLPRFPNCADIQEDVQFFNYNKHHMEKIRTAYEERFRHAATDHYEGSEVDPVFNWLYSNIADGSNLVDEPKKLEFRYQMFSNMFDSDKLVSDMEMDYFQLLNGNVEQYHDSAIAPHRGLYDYDRDIKDYLHTPNYDFQMHLEQPLDPFTAKQFFDAFNDFNDQLTNNNYEAEDESDIVEKFYDDMNDMYYK